MKKLRVLSLALLALSTFTAAHADSIAFGSQSGNTYNYNLVLTGPADSFSVGNTLSITGLFGILGVTPTSTANAYGILSYTSTSVTLTVTSPQSYVGPGTTLSLFSLLASPSDVLGGARFAVNETATSYSGAVSGPVAGPVAPTAEPTSLVLCGSGILSLAGMLRRRKQPSQEVACNLAAA